MRAPLAAAAATCAAAVELLAASVAATSARADPGASGVSADGEEGNVVPLAGGNTDVGYGGGAFGNLARTEPGHPPYVWNLDVAALVTFKVHSPGGVERPFEQLYFGLTVPEVTRRLRVELRASYVHESTTGYYGVGDASIDAVPARLAGDGDAQRRYYEFDRVHPTVTAITRTALDGGVFAYVGAQYTYNEIGVYADSKLAEDMRGWNPRPLRHGVALFEYALQYDSRDDEIETSRGVFHQAKLRVSPGAPASDALPYRYGSVDVIARAFAPIVGRRIVFATRFVGDVLFGDPPFYELARYEETFAIGGVNGVRGVPSPRYAGRLKAFANFELRTFFAEARALGKDLVFGGVLFVDAGRVWAETPGRPDLDGTGLGLKYGVGGGLRVRSGKTFVLRVDVGWSPDARPIGAYFTAGETF